MANNSFSTGNAWRFSADSQPQRKMTILQLRKRLEELLSMTDTELNNVISDKDVPGSIKISAKQIIEGNIHAVTETINSLRKCQKEDTKKKGTRSNNC